MADVQVLVNREPQSRNTRELRGRERCIYLASPKTCKTNWLTAVGPNLVWGNQEMMWPLTNGALNAEPTGRLIELSIPKKDFRNPKDGKKHIHVYSCGRNSVIWEVSPLAMRSNGTERLTNLAQYKKLPVAYQQDRATHALSCGRSSPIWSVSNAAKKAVEKERIESLARSKTPHRDYLPAREVETIVGGAAKRAVASPRLEYLANPKSRPVGPFRDSIWPVSASVLKASVSPRQLELSKPKSVAEGYQPARSIQWEVKRSAKRAVATSRTNELAQPITRETMHHVQFNPDAFVVSEAAKKGRCPPRVEELAIPIQR
ncbi:testicular haploid expressed gene protein-like [Anneissia japonica]|uniref:testicular haploid expressed gene protein-like n=1 Tax=Anneissia japonica TaxID=1529436 RepID=UPI0014255992|nr:testicular haploid expressed gene protein-like [Anneissia japonica]